MATLYFEVSADYDKVIRLREEISKLESQLKGMGSGAAPQAVEDLEGRLASARQQMTGMVSEAAKAGAAMEGGFKKKIYDASQTVNDLSGRIIAQKAVIKDVEADVKRLGEAYRAAVKRSPAGVSSTLADWTQAKRVLDEEKAALFGLTQEQATARLSVKKLRDEYALFREDSGDTSDALNEMRERMAGLGKKLLAGWGLEEFVGQMVRVRGEFQMADTAIQTLLGNKEKADELLAKVREYAKISPLEFSDVTKATQMMLGFNIEAEKVPRFIQAIGDVSMGDTNRFNSLVLAFSQMSAAGRLMGQDLLQFINAGFNPLQQIAEKTGKSMATLKDEMSKGAISTEMVQQAFMDATSAGGKFYNMSENASKTINGQLSMMRDAIDLAFNEMGEATEGTIMKGIQATTSLISNYETIGKALVGLITTYGTYKAALMASTVVEQARNGTLLANITATRAYTVAQAALNSVMKANPYALAATALVGVATAIWTLYDSSTDAEKAAERLNERQREAASIESERKRRIESLVDGCRDIALADAERGNSLAELRREYPRIFEQYDIETIKLADILSLKQQIAAEDSKRAGEREKQELADIESDIKYYETLLGSLSGGQEVGWYANRLRELRADRDLLLEESGKGISERFIATFKDIGMDTLDGYISELESRISGKGGGGKVRMRLPVDIEGTLSDEAIYDVKDIKTLIETAKSSRQSRIDSESGRTTYKQDLASARSAWEEAKSGYEAILRDQESTTEQVKEAKKRMEAAAKAYEDLGGSTKSQAASGVSAGASDKIARDQKRIGDELLDLRRKNQQAEIDLMAEGSEKRLARIDLDYDNEIAEILAREKEWKEAQGGETTDGQTAEIRAALLNAYVKRERSKADVGKDMESEWNEYYIKYGNYLEKRDAIIKKYDDQLAATESGSGAEATLLREREAALGELDDSVRGSATLMGELFADAAQKSVGEIQKIIDKAETLMAYIGATKDADGKAVIGERTVSRDDMLSLGVSENTLRGLEESTDKVESLRNGIESLRKELSGRSAFTRLSEDIGKASRKIKSGDMAGGIEGIGNAVTEFMPALSRFGEEIGTIFGDDGLGEMISGVADALGGLAKAGAGIGQIMSGDVAGGVMGAVSGVSSLVSAIGGLFGADYSAYNDLVEQYDGLLDIWDDLIEKKKEYISIDYGAESANAAAEALELLEKEREVVRTLATERLGSGSSAGSHSIGYRMWKGSYDYNGLNWQDVADEIEEAYGVTFDQMSDMLYWDPDVLERVKESYAGLWAVMDDDFREYLEQLIEYGETAEDIADQLKESMTGITFDSFYDSFVDTLSDMDSDSEDFADDFEGYLQNAILSSLVANQYKSRIQALYDQWSEYAESDSQLSTDEVSALKEEYNGMVEDLLADRESLASAFGWDTSSSQTATSGAYTTMSEETGEELNGRFTALQVTGEEIRSLAQVTNEWLEKIYSCLCLAMPAGATTADGATTGAYSPQVNVVLPDDKIDGLADDIAGLRAIVDEMRTLQVAGNLDRSDMLDNSTSVVKPIIQMQKDITEIKKNTNNL